MECWRCSVRSAKPLYFLSSHPVDLICIQESNLTHLPLGISGFSALRSDCTNSRSGILSCDATHASGDVITFVWQSLSFSELSTSSLSSLDPYSDYVGVNISLNNSSSLSFLNVYTPPIRSSPDGWQNRLLFSLHSFLLRKYLHSGDFNCHHPFWDSKGNSNPRREEVFYWVISSDLFPSMILTHPPFYIAPPLTSPLLPLLLPFLAPGRCFRTWVLTTYQFF